jgi:DNA repair exonuclease SbcCD nuclease subunit
MKFIHLGDCHLGAWRQPELKWLNFESFKFVIDRTIKEKADFVIITGDLFDSAYPPIEILKEVFQEFRRLKDAKIPVFLIAGSHDYSASGKTFLDVLEKAGFCKNLNTFEERNGSMILEPLVYGNVAIYGYPGKKSGLEVDDLERLKIQDSPGLFKILMLHTAIRDAIGSLPIKAVDEKKLPKVDYLALSHLHIKYNRDGRVYSGPTFPNNLPELEELGGGSFYIVESGRPKREEIKIRELASFTLKIKDALTATDEILSTLQKENIRNKIIILRLSGILEKGKISDIDFQRIEDFIKKEGAFVFLRSTSNLHMPELELKLDLTSSEQIETQIIRGFEDKNPNKFNVLIPELLKVLQADKLDDEKSSIFEERLMSETKKVLQI